MFYSKGGAAWSDTRYSASINLGELTDGEQSVSVKKTRVGALFGTGIEYAFLPNWSAKIEYNYIDFGHKNYVFDIFDGFVSFDTKINERMHVVKGGLNWRFNSPVIGAY
jgi:outer membrane immunogenic protein